MIHFHHPLWLFGLFALLIPIVIHLFNFRRYKTVYFSNVKLLQEIRKKTKRESQLLHLIVLFLRMIAITFLVLAFAQPYVPQQDKQTTDGNLVAIYVDNSFSMHSFSKEGNLLEDAVASAKKIVDAFSFSDDFLLITNDFLGKHSRVFNRDEIVKQLNEIEISPQSRSIEEIIDFKNHLTTLSRKQRQYSYYLSDFQENRCDLQCIIPQNNENVFLLPFPAEEQSNVSIDSCWLLSPVFKEGQQADLNVRIHNYGANDVLKLPLKLYVNEEQKAIASVDIKANSYTDCQLRYMLNSSGIQCATLTIEDAPIMFDDNFYFTYELLPSTRIIAIFEKDNRYLNALYGQDSLFSYQAMNVNHINYAAFKEAELIILDQINSVSSGLAAELKQFVEAGGDLLIFPALEMELDSWKIFLENSFGSRSFSELNSQEIRMGTVNQESPYFKDAFEKTEALMSYPTINSYYSLSNSSSSPAVVIMELENKLPLLTVQSVEKGNLFLSTIAMNDEYGDAHKHALFFIPLHNIGIKSQKQVKLYHIIGKDNFYHFNKKAQSAEDVFVAKLKNNGSEFIPEQRRVGNETILYFHSQVDKAGFYDIEQGGVVQATIAFNYSRSESNLSYHTEHELVKFASQHDKVKVIDANKKNLTKEISTEISGKSYWRWMLGIALLAFLTEILVLRFWGKAHLKKD